MGDIALEVVVNKMQCNKPISDSNKPKSVEALKDSKEIETSSLVDSYIIHKL